MAPSGPYGRDPGSPHPEAEAKRPSLVRRHGPRVRPDVDVPPSTALVVVAVAHRRGESRVVVSGEIDISTARELDRRLHDHLDGVTAGGSLLIDFSRVSHFSAAGLCVVQRLAASAADRGIAVLLDPLSRSVERVLDICAVDAVLTELGCSPPRGDPRSGAAGGFGDEPP